MTRAPKSASVERIATTNLTTLDYLVPVNAVSTPFLGLTNLTANVLDISVYINDGSADFLLIQGKVAGGIGKEWFVKELSTQKLNAGFTVKVQSTTADAFNAFLSVSEISNN
jgi:hypothetical protein